ncbi:MAG: 2-oxoacid:ferredoxin oxidoreductase subunit beta [Thermoplasmata archaeon]|nr:MAG: 2-oxoacid:ferredoxin oxidoreductase subunit beta [Thermoplasmata archaeon]HEC88973.1 2-oxoacid:ferredoxin oxidoreductase subunit beta [Thermoplasmatales archaeon]
MIDKQQERMERYLRLNIFPTTFCPGCGCGSILNAFIHALDDLDIPPEEVVTVTGIGCSSWIPSPYFKGDVLHTTHGRSIAFATGVKIVKPDMRVVVFGGDGDLIGIGGNHLIHAARRNIDLTVFLVNNFVYGMTGGQVSPTTPYNIQTTTTPYGNVENPFSIAEVIASSGASYVARWTTYHIFQLVRAMKEALQKKGFSFIEIISQCPMNYGRAVKLRSGPKLLKLFREKSINIKEVENLTEEETRDKFIVGTLVNRDKEEFTERLRDAIRRAEER